MRGIYNGFQYLSKQRNGKDKGSSFLGKKPVAKDQGRFHLKIKLISVVLAETYRNKIFKNESK